MYPSLDETERRADAIVHAIGLVFIAAASFALIFQANDQIDQPNGMAIFWAVSAYIVCIAFSHVISMLYHLSPLHARRLVLRRIDHAAIYLTIAGTFAPLFVIANTDFSLSMLVLIWVLIIPPILYKIFGTNLDSRWSQVSYLALGWIGIIAVPDLMEQLPEASLWVMLAGGIFYSIGSIFYARKSQPFRYSIWHVFVMMGGASFFGAIWIALTNV